MQAHHGELEFLEHLLAPEGFVLNTVHVSTRSISFW
jgi:hypothetical protein